MPRLLCALATVGLLLAAPTAALAHKLKVFATAVGTDVSGYAYFSPGGRAQESAVTVSLPDGSVVQHLTTDANGEFRFAAQQSADLTILVDAGDGHEATYHLPADQLGVARDGAGPLPARARDSAADATPVTMTSSLDASQVAALVDQAVARQLRPLREQIDAWQEKIWLHDVLGGLGYIIGLGGLVYGLTGNRRSRTEDARQLKEARR